VREVVHGVDFNHVIYRNAHFGAGPVLHVYIEGDGSPYLDRWTVAPDPTPHRPIMLQLMTLDPGPAIYVGRPCYFGLAQDPPCTALDWTLGRFGERVIASMAQVIRAAAAEGGDHRIELYGHSGGGAIAVLLAHRLPGVVRVVTLAGNLDTDAWAAAHHYTALAGSLNPVVEGRLDPGIRQQHLVGARDAVMPPALVDEAARRIGGSGAQVLPGVTHTTGWRENWPAILAGQ
jgi:pimeloyl-ACP methyl ester carboxylesterase